MRETLRSAREEKKLTVSEVANALGISASFYYKIEQDIRNPTMKLAKQISNLLGQSVEQFFFTHDLYDKSKNFSARSTGTEGR